MVGKWLRSGDPRIHFCELQNHEWLLILLTSPYKTLLVEVLLVHSRIVSDDLSALVITVEAATVRTSETRWVECDRGVRINKREAVVAVDGRQSSEETH